MRLQLAALSGVLGVILTVAFFALGYRQTIIARRKRARGANELALNALYRRLTLEDGFGFEIRDLSSLLGGWALGAGVSVADMHSVPDFVSVLLARVVDSDHIAPEKRSDVLIRLAGWLQNYAEFQGRRVSKSPKIGLSIEAMLAIAAAAAGIASAILILLAFDKTFSAAVANSDSVQTYIPPIVFGAALSTITSIGLFFFVRSGEASQTSDAQDIDMARIRDMRRKNLFDTARRVSTLVEALSSGVADFSFEDSNHKYAVAIGDDVNQLRIEDLSKLVTGLDRLCTHGGFERAYLVSRTDPGSRALQVVTERVRIIQDSELSGIVRDANLDSVKWMQ